MYKVGQKLIIGDYEIYIRQIPNLYYIDTYQNINTGYRTGLTSEKSLVAKQFLDSQSLRRLLLEHNSQSSGQAYLSFRSLKDLTNFINELIKLSGDSKFIQIKTTTKIIFP
jgi:hypothetical protein